MHMIREKYTLDFFQVLSKFEDEEKPKIFYEFFQADAKKYTHTYTLHNANDKLIATATEKSEKKKQIKKQYT